MGSATTPALEKLNGTATLTFRAAAWDGKKELTTLTLSIDGGATLDKTTVELKKGQFNTYTVQITGGTPNSKITFAAAQPSNNRFFLDDVVITAEGEGVVKKAAGLKFSETEISIEKGQAFTSPTFSQTTTSQVTFTSDNEDVATVDNNGVISLAGGVGTATITATSEANDEYYAGTAKCKVSVTEPITYNTFVKATTITSGKKYLLVAQRDETTNYAMSLSEDRDYGYLNAKSNEGTIDTLKVESRYDDAFLITETNDGYTIQDSYGRYLYQKEAYNNFNVDKEENHPSWTIEPQEDGTFKIAMNGYFIQWGEGKYTSFGLYTEKQENTVLPMLYQLEDKADNSFEIKEGEGYATVYREKAFIMPENVEGGIVTNVNKDKSLAVDYRYKNGEIVPAKTPILVKGNAGSYTFEYTESTESAPAGNLLRGAEDVKDGKTFVEGANVKYYVLSKGTVDNKEIIGFFFAAENGASVDYQSGKAFLAVDFGTSLAAPRMLSLDGEATGIDDVKKDIVKGTNTIYTIAGQRLNKKANELQKGLYIVNGKKVIIK